MTQSTDENPLGSFSLGHQSSNERKRILPENIKRTHGTFKISRIYGINKI